MPSSTHGNDNPTVTIPSVTIFGDDDPAREYRFLRMATYNMVWATGNNLNIILRVMARMRIELGILTETHLTHDKYTHICCGYNVVATKVENKHIGGVALFYRSNSKQWTVEGIRTHGPNVISCTLVSGKRRWTLIGCYIPPSEDDGTTLDYIQEAIRTRAHHPLILLGDLNIEFHHPKDSRSELLTDGLALYGLTDLSNSYRKPTGSWTWSQRKDDGYIRSVTDYILVDCPQDFSRWTIKSPRYYSDHRAVVAELRLVSKKRHRRYLHRRQYFPIRLPLPPTRLDSLFSDLKNNRLRLEPKTSRDRSWISEATWRLIDRRADLKRKLNFARYHIQIGQTEEVDRLELLNQMKQLGRDIRKGLRQDRRRRIKRTSDEILTHLAAGRIHEAFQWLRTWYHDYSGIATRPTWHDIEAINLEYQALYEAVPSPGDPVPVHVMCVDVDDNIPTPEEITKALSRMRLGRRPGPSGIRVEDLRHWQQHCPILWEQVVDLVQSCFSGKDFPATFAQAILVLIPKDVHGKYRGIVLLEVLYKLCSTIIHLRLLNAIQFHSALHGFRPGRGTRTAILEAKLLQQLAVLETAPLFQVFLDLTKAYDSLDRDRVLEVLSAYGVGPNLCRFIRTFWNCIRLVPKVGGYFGKPVSSTRGTLQGDVISPDIFNIVIDCIVRHWEFVLSQDGVPLESSVHCLFYADDGNLVGFTSDKVQGSLDLFVDLFARFGLKVNVDKTKMMVTCGPRRYFCESVIGYKRRRDKSLPSYRERKRSKVTCSRCGRSLNSQGLPRHLRYVHDLSRLQIAADFPPPEDNQDSTTDPQVYTISFPNNGFSVLCPVPGCDVSCSTRSKLRYHFAWRHLRDTLHIQEQAEFQACPKCGYYLSEVTAKHLASGFCAKLQSHREGLLQEAARATARRISFQVGSRSLALVDHFRYLGRIFSDDDRDTIAVTANLKKARECWGRIHRLLRRDGASLIYDSILSCHRPS